MIIGFDGSRAFIDQKTGTENYSFELLKHLAQIDIVNYYVVYIRPGQKVSGNWPNNFKFKVLNFKYLWTQAGLALQTFKDPIDLLFTPAHTLPLIRRPGLKTLITVHDLGAEYLPSTHQIKQRLYLSLMTHHQLKTATHLLAVSEATKKDLINKVGIEPGKITVTYEGFKSDLTNINSHPEFISGSHKEIPKQVHGSLRNRNDNILKEYGVEKGNYFLFVGSIQPRKNLERLIKAFHQSILNDPAFSKQKKGLPKLVLIGRKGWLADDIYNLPKALGILENVKFLGYIEDKQLRFFYQGAKALLYPSLFEGFGLPILEAFALSCPVLTANTSSMPEVAGEAAVLVDPYSIQSISEGIVKISDPMVAQKLVKKGQEQLKKFSWERCARQTLEAINSLG